MSHYLLERNHIFLIERNRIHFLIIRDGVESAKKTCLMYARVYRECVLQTGRNNRKFHHASIPQYRRGFIESYLAFKRFALQEN